jgi:hypothetical protein
MKEEFEICELYGKAISNAASDLCMINFMNEE